MIFAYLGPDTVLPLTSTLAAVVGVFLMFGRQTVRIGRMVVLGGFRVVRRSPAHVPHGVRADVAHLRARRPSAAARLHEPAETQAQAQRAEI